MILFQSEKTPSGLREKILVDSKKDFIPITAYTLVNGIVDGYFYKKINMPKVYERYSGDYVKLLIEYYTYISKYIKANKLIEIFENNGDVFEILNPIDSSLILCDNNDISYVEILNLFKMVLEGILELEKKCDKKIGIDSAIWNYSKDGVFFDYDPPKILRGNSLFITPNDLDYEKRVLFRNFNYLGMKLNTLGTIILGHNNWNFNIVNLPNNYVEELLEILYESLDDEEIVFLKNKIYGVNDIEDFDKHPINIIRKELKK